jgi:hypothetical protein
MAGAALVFGAALTLGAAGGAEAQSCTTQARMTAEERSGLADAALGLATAVKAGDVTKVQASAVAEYGAKFGSTAALILATAEKISGDTPEVAQAYELDGSKRAAGDTSEAEFTCPLKETVSETDFSIPALPPGVYGFVMVEAKGARPWLLSMLLRKEGGVWKLAGLSTHTRAAGGHDGLWYWKAARIDASAKELWLAWLLYGEADTLLRPASFVTSTNLDKLDSELHAATPPELVDGIGERTPLVVKGEGGAEFRFVGIGTEFGDEGGRSRMMLHMSGDWVADPAAAKARNVAAAKALLEAHKELRRGFDGVWVFAESEGHEPVATELKMAEIP